MEKENFHHLKVKHSKCKKNGFNHEEDFDGQKQDVHWKENEVKNLEHLK